MRIARELIDPDADKVVRRLARHGFQAYLVGGCVRDLLLQRTPKDFDVATNATPKEIRQLFRNCRIIGRRFRLAHIFFGPKIIETSTFRANPREGDDASDSDELLIRRDNVFGTDTEDARRRDFTINGLFYDVEAERVIDHVGGLADLERRVVRTIGDPDIRFREDPVRMLRAVKFAARLDFTIEPVTLAALIRHRGEIAKCAQPRVLEELYRLLRGGAAHRSMALLIETGLASNLSPQLATLLGRPPGGRLGPPPELPAAPARPAATPSDVEDAVTAPFRRVRADTEESSWAAVWADDAEAEWNEPSDTDPSSPHPFLAPADLEVTAEHEVGPIREEAEEVGLDLAAAAAEILEEEDDEDEDELADDADDGEEEEDDEDELADDADDRDERALTLPHPRVARPASAAAPGTVEERRVLAWSMLSEIDRRLREGSELSNSLLLAAVCVPFVFDDLLGNDVRPIEANDVVLEVLHPLVQQLQIARRDAERCRQILLAQRRLAPARRRRAKPMALVRRDFFGDALLAYEMMARVGGHDTADLGYWTKLHAQDGAGERSGEFRTGKRRRRRRGGRRRRRSTMAEEQGGERDLAP
ncbi:MAG TPA: polynucleotide adenylyltransferase PcnB [Kofleriaceae bacterium]|nr:polynucleotide adenylyltransferase PcnB [Kofleriaceae bacterium]